MSAQVTEAHREIARRITGRTNQLEHFAQLIADSEAQATAELRGALALGQQNCDDVFEDLRLERDQLRAEVDAQCLLNAKGSEREAVLLRLVDRMAKECLNLRADLDAIKAIRNEETARAERAEVELATERARLKEMAAELAHCAGYIASVRTDRQITWHEELYALQTVEWAEGAVEIAEKANAVLEAHDAAMKEGTK